MSLAAFAFALHAVPAALALDCWAGEFTEARCCASSYGPGGNPSCWNGPYSYENCCKNSGAARSSRRGGQKSEGSNSQGVVATEKKKTSSIDGVVVGIDLGTTYSAVAIFRGERVEVITNDQGNRVTPSAVTFLESGERLVGESAKFLLSTHPTRTVYDAKRLIGRGMQDRSVQVDKKSFPFKVVDRGGRPHIDVGSVRGNALVLAPEEVSAMVLRKMKDIAEAYLGEEVRHAVVTVPAYFSDNQRSATMVAGEIAGLNVVRILNEPTAAAIAYGLEKKKAKKGKSETKALVYDLGGGTFDVSVLSIADGVFQTLATSGNTHLGGEDFDQNVVKYVLGEFKQKTGKDPSGDRRAMQKLKTAVERAKRALSSSVSANVEVDDFYKGLELNEPLSRAKFEQLNSELFSKTLEPVKQVLADAGLKVKDIDEVVMVGGSTRIPKVQQLIQEFFNLKASPTHVVNPDEVVAAGAAIQAGILWQGSAAGRAVTGGKKSWDLVLVDVTPLSLGIEIEGGHMVTLIPRNTLLPTKKTKTFSTVHDKQTSVYIPIYEGERPIANKNIKLGDMMLTGIPPAPVGVPQISVTFRIDANGILHVTAQDQGTKAEASVTINANKGRLSDEEVERMVKDAQRHAERDKDLLARRAARAALKDYLNSLQVSVLGPSSSASEEDRKTLEEAVAATLAWLQDSRRASLEDIQEKRLEVEDVANPIVSRLYQGRGAPGSGPSYDDEEDATSHDPDAGNGDDFFKEEELDEVFDEMEL